MSPAKHFVTIKGIKDGLLFVMDDSCRYTDLLKDLHHKLDKTHQKILTGPVIHVFVKLGSRILNEADKEELKTIISQRGNLFVQSIESDPPEKGGLPVHERIEWIRGIVRSGQTIRYEGNVLLLGDVNPGGTVEAAGDIYVLGSLRGMAHAGVDGNEKAVIAASHLRPTQLRIAGVISRPPDEWGIEEAVMEFAYIRDGVMEIDKIHQLHRIRPETE
jgi:septum site-determining protein MinC